MEDGSKFQVQPEWGIKFSRFFIIPQRVILALMGFFCVAASYTMRVCISVALTELVVEVNRTSEANSSEILACPMQEDISGETPKAHGGTYDWSQELQGHILSSFYVGYILSHIPGGLLAEKFGAKWVLSLGMLISAIFTLLTPWGIENAGPNVLIAFRIIMGLGQGTMFPALSFLLAQWIPITERGLLGALVLGAGQIGTVVGNSLSGIIIAATNWQNVFYFFGLLTVLWFIIFSLLCYSDPASHPFIKSSEKDYLMATMGRIGRRRDMPPTPWGHIFRSLPVWALNFAQIGHDFGLFVMTTDLPKYMKDVMNFDVKTNGILSSLPFLAMWMVSLPWGYLTDHVIKHEYMSVTAARKWNTTIAAIGPALFMVAASYAGCDRFLVVLFFTLCMATMGTYYSGMKLCPLDMSPNYSGTLMAISNGLGAIAGVAAPVTIGYMTPNASMLEWRVVFWVTFIMLVWTLIVFLIWASSEVQPWNDPDKMEPRSAA